MELFKQEMFDIFQVQGLDDRMDQIRSQIQPIFQGLQGEFQDYINNSTGRNLGFHIAQHLRRTVNPPEATWCAFGGNNRGYKKYPHLQVQINADHIFIGLALIDNPKYRKEIGQEFQANPNHWQNLSGDFYISQDHTKTDLLDLNQDNMEETVDRLVNVKKGEIMLGRIIRPDSPLLEDDQGQEDYIKETFDKILPLYKQSLDCYFKLDR